MYIKSHAFLASTVLSLVSTTQSSACTNLSSSTFAYAAKLKAESFIRFQKGTVIQIVLYSSSSILLGSCPLILF